MLVIKNLTKIYKGTTKGITDISLHIQPGDIYAFIGHNGAGKTTLLRAVTGIHAYDEGSVTIDGLDLAKEPVAASSASPMCRTTRISMSSSRAFST